MMSKGKVYRRTLMKYNNRFKPIIAVTLAIATFFGEGVSVSASNISPERALLLNGYLML